MCLGRFFLKKLKDLKTQKHFFLLQCHILAEAIASGFFFGRILLYGGPRSGIYVLPLCIRVGPPLATLGPCCRTIGYGDITPTSLPCRLFWYVYVFIGFGIMMPRLRASPLLVTADLWVPCHPAIMPLL